MVLVHTRPRRCTIKPNLIFIEVARQEECLYEDWGAALGSIAHAAAEVSMTYVMPHKYTGRAAATGTVVFAAEVVPNTLVMQRLRDNIAGIATDHPGVTIVMHHVGHSERLSPNEAPSAVTA